MAIFTDFVLFSAENGIVTVAMTPPTPIGGWTLQFTMTHRPNGTPIIVKSMASGYYGTSGMNIVNSGQGIMSIALYPSEVSGLDPSTYAWNVYRLDSGFATDIAQGYRLMSF